MKKKLKQAHKDVQKSFKELAEKHSEEIGIPNFIYLMLFECFRCLWCEAPTVKEARALMKDAMNDAKEISSIDKKKIEKMQQTNKTLH